jgi:hypothetical protein
MEVAVRSDLKSLALCFLISSLDILTTYLLLNLQKGVERGFIVGLLLNLFGLTALPFYAPIEAFIMFLVFKSILSLRVKLKVGFKVEYVFLLVVLYPVVNNITLLLS